MKTILYFPLVLLALLLGACKDTPKQAGSESSVNAESGISKILPGRPEDALVGEFSSAENGKPEVRITKDGDAYFASILMEGQWSPPEPLTYQMTEKDMQMVFGSKSDQVETILAADGFFIAKLPKGTDLGGGVVVPDKYLAFLAIMPFPLYKL